MDHIEQIAAEMAVFDLNIDGTISFDEIQLSSDVQSLCKPYVVGAMGDASC